MFHLNLAVKFSPALWDLEFFTANYTLCLLTLSIILFAYVWYKWDYWCWTVALQCCYCSSSASQINKPALFRQESIYLTQSHGARTGAEQGILCLSFSFSFFHPPFLFFQSTKPPLPAALHDSRERICYIEQHPSPRFTSIRMM